LELLHRSATVQIRISRCARGNEVQILYRNKILEHHSARVTEHQQVLIACAAQRTSILSASPSRICSTHCARSTSLKMLATRSRAPLCTCPRLLPQRAARCSVQVKAETSLEQQVRKFKEEVNLPVPVEYVYAGAAWGESFQLPTRVTAAPLSNLNIQVRVLNANCGTVLPA
jgi:hypothetical protein